MGYLIEEPVPKRKSITGRASSLSEFCDEAVKEFVACGFKQARIEGFPGGNPATERELARVNAALSNSARKTAGLVRCCKRGTRFYLRRTAAPEDDRRTAPEALMG